MVTLDGTPFTFNGHGEYSILKVRGVNFTLQGRMEPLVNEDGSQTDATVYTAFAAKESGSDTVQVRDWIIRESRHFKDIEVNLEGVCLRHVILSFSACLGTKQNGDHPSIGFKICTTCYLRSRKADFNFVPRVINFSFTQKLTTMEWLGKMQPTIRPTTKTTVVTKYGSKRNQSRLETS